MGTSNMVKLVLRVFEDWMFIDTLKMLDEDC